MVLECVALRGVEVAHQVFVEADTTEIVHRISRQRHAATCHYAHIDVWLAAELATPQQVGALLGRR
jgi:hypothetical protein